MSTIQVGRVMVQVRSPGGQPNGVKAVPGQPWWQQQTCK